MIDISGGALMKTDAPVIIKWQQLLGEGWDFMPPSSPLLGGSSLTGRSLVYAVTSARLICATALLYLEVSMMLLTTFGSYNLAAPSSLKISMGGDG